MKKNKKEEKKKKKHLDIKYQQAHLTCIGENIFSFSDPWYALRTGVCPKFFLTSRFLAQKFPKNSLQNYSFLFINKSW